MTKRALVTESSKPMQTRAGEAMYKITSSTANAVSRRAFLRGLGSAAFTAAMSGMFLFTRFTYTAGAHGTCSSPCGPSPICSSSYCTSHSCKPSGGINQKYESGQCLSGSNYWTENYCSGCGSSWGGQIVFCGDCCGLTGGGSCSNCVVTRYRCICRKGYQC